MKRFFSPKRNAIKNSDYEDPEGYSIVLVTPMCNGELVRSIQGCLSPQIVVKVSMKKKGKKRRKILERTDSYIAFRETLVD